MREGAIPDLSTAIDGILENLPVAVLVVDSSGKFVSRAGRVSGLVGEVIPSRDKSAIGRWRFANSDGSLISPEHWPAARALRCEVHPDGFLAQYSNAGEHLVKVVSLPVRVPETDIAAITFLQHLDAPSRSADGSYGDLQHRLLDMMVKAVAETWSAA